MKFMKISAGIFILLAMIACGSSIGSQMCSRSFECRQERGQEQYVDTQGECAERLDDFVSNSPAEVSSEYEATWQACLDTTTCEEFDVCFNNIRN